MEGYLIFLFLSVEILSEKLVKFFSEVFCFIYMHPNPTANPRLPRNIDDPKPSFLINLNENMKNGGFLPRRNGQQSIE